MRPKFSVGLLAVVGLVAVIAAAPIIVGNNYQIFIITLIGLYTMLTIGLSLVMGYAGQVSLGHATFYGVGAYATALLSARAGLPSWAALIVAVALTALIGFIIGVPIFRLRGHYLAMATLGLNVIFSLIVKNEAEITGGPSGFSNIPPLSVGGFVIDSDIRMYYVVWAMALGTLWLSLNIVNSRVGRALRAIHTSEVAAETLGVDANAYKLRVFALAAGFAGLAGGLYAQAIHFISPSSFDILVSIELVTMAAIGGLASVWGSIFGAATVVFLGQFIRDKMNLVLAGASGEQEIIVFGILLVIIMVFLPEGLTVGGLKLLRKYGLEKR
ncbi:MAG TPA: branched-chain amino acid ABC transporter permease [Anaerolineales bacterium]|nr:branched-chain amino acid ABC transporter permease [Anaerolineales bacterium]